LFLFPIFLSTQDETCYIPLEVGVFLLLLSLLQEMGFSRAVSRSYEGLIVMG
jgi:hypothetical protein